jgi:cytochrome c-type biogenesis protein CcmH/NrfG
VFLGRALEKQGQIHPAIDAYKAATQIKPEEELAWKGLLKACETLGAIGVDGRTAAALGLAQVYAEK